MAMRNGRFLFVFVIDELSFVIMDTVDVILFRQIFKKSSSVKNGWPDYQIIDRRFLRFVRLDGDNRKPSHHNG